jgi:hypothetical protein
LRELRFSLSHKTVPNKLVTSTWIFDKSEKHENDIVIPPDKLGVSGVTIPCNKRGGSGSKIEDFFRSATSKMHG